MVKLSNCFVSAKLGYFTLLTNFSAVCRKLMRSKTTHKPTCHFVKMIYEKPSIPSHFCQKIFHFYIKMWQETFAPACGGQRGWNDIKIYNTLGECVLSTFVNFVDNSASGGQIRIDVSQLPAGVYSVWIGTATCMFVKM